MDGEKLLQQLRHYVTDTIGLPVECHPWNVDSSLPQYLREQYRFFSMEAMGFHGVLMTDTAGDEQSPAVTGKHITQVRSRLNLDVVYVRQTMSSHNRKRLIERQIPFIVPGAHLYLPMLWIDLRERLKRPSVKRPFFSPATQALMLHVLWRPTPDTLFPSQIAKTLGYSAMTMTRVFNELEAASVGDHTVVGKERQLRFPTTGKRLWEQTRPYLSTPVKRRLYANPNGKPLGGLPAGQSALAFYTAIAEPNLDSVALSIDNWNTCSRVNTPVVLPFPEPGAVEVELWKYRPEAFSKGTSVDRLSLYLSLKDSVDDRVQIALDELMEGMPW